MLFRSLDAPVPLEDGPEVGFVSASETADGELMVALAQSGTPNVVVVRARGETMRVERGLQTACVSQPRLLARCDRPLLALTFLDPEVGCRGDVFTFDDARGSWVSTELDLPIERVPQAEYIWPNRIGLDVAEDGTVAVAFATQETLAIYARPLGERWRTLGAPPGFAEHGFRARAELLFVGDTLHLAFDGAAPASPREGQVAESGVFYWIHEDGRWRPAPETNEHGLFLEDGWLSSFDVDRCGRPAFATAFDRRPEEPLRVWTRERR